MFKFFRKLWLRKEAKQVSDALASFSMSEKRVLEVGKKLEASKKSLAFLAKEQAELRNRVKTEIETQKNLVLLYEHSLEELREKNLVLKETINVLATSHKLLLARYDAEIAIQTRAKVAANFQRSD